MAVLSRRALTLAFLVAGWATHRAWSTLPSEYEVKAAFLCNFAEFVEWPVSAAPSGVSVPVTIGILGEDPFGPLIDELAHKRSLQTKTIAIRRLSSLEAARICQIVYISASEKSRLEPILRSLAPGSILTVSDIPRFAERGGMIGFVLEGKRVRFEINAETADKAGLRISSRLLNLARVVRTAQRGGG